jgi:4-amino-4-deoxy-L-arabinose transferase-like glycosyltransferase
MKLWWIVPAMALLLVVYGSLTEWVPPVDDELYYWCWSKDLQWSYYDHPPMTALLIRGSTALFGDTLFAVRFPACVATVLVLGVITWMTRPRRVLLFALFSPLFTLGAVLMTPDTPLLLFWSLYVGWLVVLHRKLQPTHETLAQSMVPLVWWAIGGLILGCGILGKYTAGLAVPAGAISFALLGRRSIGTWWRGYALHLLVAFGASAPILIYNIQHEFIPLLYQWKHSMAANATRSWKGFFEFVGVQVLLVGALPVLLLPWALWNFRRFSQDPMLRVALCLYCLPLLFFLVKAARGPLEGNWALVSYLAFWPIAARWYEQLAELRWHWRCALRWGSHATFAAPLLSVAAVGAHLVQPLPIVPIEKDRLSGMRERHELFARMAEDWIEHHPNAVLFSDTYQNVALLKYYGAVALQEEGVCRPSHFTQTPRHIQEYDRVYYFAAEPLEEAQNAAGVRGTFAEHARGFERTLLCEYPVTNRGKYLFSYKLWRYDRTIPCQHNTPSTQ